ncbi:MAG: AAA family ATPase [Paludibacter sp.]|nr:AAA family ATPase [Paludibacter sp.]
MSFKICYIWVAKFRNFENFGVNLSSQVKFQFIDNRLTKSKRDNIPDNFFGDDISDVTGFIGKNGTGKSNLLELVCMLVKGGKTSIDSDFFIIIKDKDKLVCHYRFVEFKKMEADFPISFEEYKGDLENLKVVYFSNVYDERTHIFDTKVSDLSANNRYPKNNWPSKTKTSDFVKQVQFIRSEFFVDSEIPIPKKVVVTPKISSYNSSYWERGINSNFSKNVSFAQGLKSLWSDINYLKPSKDKLYYFLLLGIITEVLNQIREFKSDNYSLDQSIEIHTEKLIEDVEQIKLTYKSKFEIAKKWKDWCERVSSEVFRRDFQNGVKSRRLNNELENLKESIRLLEKYEQFIDSKNLEISTEGSRNRKTESYILKFDDSASRLDEDFYNFMDRSNKFKLDWVGLSSGQKANLDLFSLLRFELKSIKADKVLICIDEGDLYLHPKWQADFFYKLVNLVPKFKSADYQFILTSHSPFLVSDLPRQNLVFLGDNSENSSIVDEKENIKTFGGNLGELYIDAFFMDGGLISRFAASKIQILIDKINDKSPLTEDDESLIKIIGDDFIKIQIENLRNG